MPYRPPTAEIDFVLAHVVDAPRVGATDLFAEATPDTVCAVLEEAGKLSAEVLAPLNRAGDTSPAILENGVVRTPPGFVEGYRAMAEGGYTAVNADPEHGGMGLPFHVTTAINEMMSSACLSLQVCPLLTQGQIEALEHHASDALKRTYLPRLISGEWSSTMNLTEPQAGSDVGALRSTASPNGDGTYAISGQKIYITYGDSDLVDNVVHLVLARLPDAKPGTKGISLFLVPKRVPDANGDPGPANSLRVVSLEHKMGMHGSPTCVMEYDGATGWLVGEAHGGMAAMFTMMNNARVGVAAQGVGIAEAATQAAVAYATDRKQGRTPVEGTGAIVDHADVRRMLAVMRAETFAARALTLDCAVAIDMATATNAPDWHARAALLTPIAKTYGTEVGIAAANTGIQVHGGMGFVEDTGVAQYLRDVRVTAIYEGTNGIQAMDLVGRKMADGGEAIFALLNEIAEVAAADGPLGERVAEATGAVRATTRRLLEADLQDRFAGAMPYLMALARCLGAQYHLRAAMAEGGEGPRSALARVYMTRLLPEVPGLLAQAEAGASDIYALTPDDLAA